MTKIAQWEMIFKKVGHDKAMLVEYNFSSPT